MTAKKRHKTKPPPIPNEHGSWAMLIVPLILGIAVAPTWHWRVLLLLIAAFGLFMARFTLAALVKRRRQKGGNKGYYWKWTAIYIGAAALSGLWLIFVERLWWLLVFGAAAAGLLVLNMWLLSRRKNMSIVGELSGIAGLALGAPMAYYVAGGQLNSVALWLWVITALYFGGTVFYIKLKVRRQPKMPAPNTVGERLLKAKACLGYQTIALTILILLVTLQQMPILAPLALIPATVKALRGAWRWQDKESLSLIRLGVAEIFHSIVFAALVIFAFRQNIV